MSNQKNNDLEEQLNILFDDFSDSFKKNQTQAAETAEEDVSSLLKAEEIPEAVEKAVEEAVPDLDDTALKNEFSDFDFESLDSMINDASEDEAPKKAEEVSASSVFEDAEPVAFETPSEADEDDDLGGNKKPAKKADKPARKERPVKKAAEAEDDEEKPAPRKQRNTADQQRKENIHFWAFTGIVALIVILAILFILFKKGIIFGDDETTPAAEIPTIQTSATEAAATSAEVTTAEEVTSEEETTVEESTKKKKKKKKSSSETTEAADESASAASDTESIVNNYANMFVVVTETGGALNVRQQPSTDAPIIATIENYGGGEIIEQTGDFYHILSNGIDGYVSAAFVKTGEEAQALAKEHCSMQVRITGESVNVRSGASAETELIDTTKQNLIYEYLGEENGFYHIQYNATYEGYVSSDYSAAGYFLTEAVPYSE